MLNYQDVVMKFPALLLLLLVVAGCNRETSTGSTRSGGAGGDSGYSAPVRGDTVTARIDSVRPGFAGTGWKLVAYRTVTGGVVAGDPRTARTTLAFTDSVRCGGNTGCNRFGGDYSADSPMVGQVSFGPLMMTKMYCPAVGMFETMYATALSGSLGYRLTRDSLVLVVSSPPNDSAIAELRYVPSGE